MRVIHVLDHSAPLATSYATRTLAMLGALRALGWETFPITGPKQGPGTALEEEVDGWRFYRCPPPGGLLEGVPVLGEFELMGEITYRIEQVARRVHPHLLHAHSPVLNALPALRVARRLGIPAIYEVRSFWEDAAEGQGAERHGGLRYRATRALESWALRRATSIITVSEGLRTDLVRRGIPEHKLNVIRHAAESRPAGEADEELRRSLALDGKFVVGLLGPLYAFEGAGLLVQAAALLAAAHADLRLLFVGGGPEAGALRELAARLGIAAHVVFADQAREADFARYRALMDVVASPRASARITELVAPVKILEAMAQGAVVVASDVGGHRELIDGSGTGLLFPPGDARALARAIEALKASPERRAEIGAAARRYVDAERNWEANAAAYGAVYQRLTRLSAER